MGQGSNRAPQGQEWNLSKLNYFDNSKEVGDMSIQRGREDGMLLGGSGEMAIVRVRTVEWRTWLLRGYVEMSCY